MDGTILELLSSRKGTYHAFPAAGNGLVEESPLRVVVCAPPLTFSSRKSPRKNGAKSITYTFICKQKNIPGPCELSSNWAVLQQALLQQLLASEHGPPDLKSAYGALDQVTFVKRTMAAPIRLRRLRRSSPGHCIGTAVDPQILTSMLPNSI